MKWGLFAILLSCAFLPADAQIKRDDRPSLLNSDPEVIYFEEIFDKPFELDVTKEAPIFYDRKGAQKLGVLPAGQKIQVLAITDKVYRVRGKNARGEVVGWIAPWALESAKDPAVAENLKKFYVRHMEVRELIAAKQVAVGMTTDEVGQSLGKPTKTEMRRTSTGESGSWEFIEYEEVKHYITRIDPVSGGVFRQLSHITREEKGKTTVEFENGLVTAVSESENNGPGNVKIIVPPLVFGW
ncbi:MAG TPA: hypothetical protein VM511_08260 [Luteolibacter sp.]|nr:hypothetical protein [Luteolibacter sp.]